MLDFREKRSNNERLAGQDTATLDAVEEVVTHLIVGAVGELLIEARGPAVISGGAMI